MRYSSPIGAFGLMMIAAGCRALFPAGPPTAPFVEPLSGRPTEYRWKPFTWTPGIVALYRTIEFTERVDAGGRASSSVEEHTQAFSAIELTPMGFVRVRASVDGHPFVDLVFDQTGLVVDAVALSGVPADIRDEAAKAVVAMWQHPTSRQYLGHLFRLHEPAAFEVPIGELFAPLARVMTITGTLAVRVTFTGHKRLGKTEVVELAGTVVGKGALHYRFIERDRTLSGTLQELSGSVTEHYHAASGLLVARYETLAWSSAAHGEAFRITSATTLDVTKSRMISHCECVSPIARRSADPYGVYVGGNATAKPR